MTNNSTATARHINQVEIDAIKAYAAFVIKNGDVNQILDYTELDDVEGRSSTAYEIQNYAEQHGTRDFDHAWTEDEGMVVLRALLEMVGYTEQVPPLRAGLKAIEHIELDDVAHLADALKARQKYLRANAARNASANFQVGETVKLQGLKPKYINGTQGEVVSISTDGKISVKVTVASDHRVSRFGSIVTVAASCVQSVDPS